MHVACSWPLPLAVFPNRPRLRTRWQMRMLYLTSAILGLAVIATNADAVRAPLSGECFFANGSVEVNARCRSVLAWLADFWRQDAAFQTGPPPVSSLGPVAVGATVHTGRTIRFSVQGHADDLRGPAFDNALSVRRAAAVARALSDLGVPVEDITLIGMGSSTRRVPQIGDQTNRRVVIYERP